MPRARALFIHAVSYCPFATKVAQPRRFHDEADLLMGGWPLRDIGWRKVSTDRKRLGMKGSPERVALLERSAGTRSPTSALRGTRRSLARLQTAWR